MVRALRKERKLGIARLREQPVGADAVAGLEGAFRDVGIALRATPSR
jgi:hypothetical protein